mmetsp:Transcript_102654/g.203786  ORF Transcript_102654/g.203786 Transcript_102654/m.203786 type:complete len:352 (-) Transcript_102654:61-1116(-)
MSAGRGYENAALRKLHKRLRDRAPRQRNGPEPQDPLKLLLNKLPRGWKADTRLVQLEQPTFAKVKARIARWKGMTLASALRGKRCNAKMLRRAIEYGYLGGRGLKPRPRCLQPPCLPPGWTIHSRLVMCNRNKPRTERIRDLALAWSGKTVKEALKEPSSAGRRDPGQTLVHMIKCGYFLARRHGTSADDGGASIRDAPTKAFTVRGAQLCWLILHKKKTIENRPFKMAPGFYALHCSKVPRPRGYKLTKEQQLSCGRNLPPDERELSAAFCGHIVGAVQIGAAKSYEECAKHPWATRQQSATNNTSWCMDITKVVDLSDLGPLRAKGNERSWQLPSAVRAKLARRLRGRA